jgi:hypothetical protein
LTVDLTWRDKTLFFMASNEDLEKRIEYLEKEVKHLKAFYSIK